MKNKKGFTLVELLAVIVILAVILIIAIPQIMDTIKTTRLKTMEGSAKLIATNADKDYLAQQVINSSYNATSIPCSDVAKLSDDYSSCSITYDSNGVATVKLKGASGGKFDGIICKGTKDNIDCKESNSSSNWVYAFGNITDEMDGEEDFNNLGNAFERRPVFIRFNKNDLSERYVCTTYNMENNEPTCISVNAYNTSNDTDAEWNTIKALFGVSNCSGTGSLNYCSTGYWRCTSMANSSSCKWETNTLHLTCVITSTGNPYCNRVVGEIQS